MNSEVLEECRTHHYVCLDDVIQVIKGQEIKTTQVFASFVLNIQYHFSVE